MREVPSLSRAEAMSTMESIKNHAVSVGRIAFMIQTGPDLSVWAMVLRKRVKSAPSITMPAVTGHRHPLQTEKLTDRIGCRSRPQSAACRLARCANTRLNDRFQEVTPALAHGMALAKMNR
ncbi:hypothetical protein [uncultured Desulfosarcina sp.]|uniref:hypothetical protein n=1 Tax=uncultured Desulfosarcina sp. TaxID=218289 RepID=UPI0029C8EC14|nr:hypothetical protein [uncultured Desulfosarcina sp.]